jgi:hypothetical protein
LFAITSTEIVWFSTGLIALISGAIVWIALFNKDYLMPSNGLKRALQWIGARS